jgi:nicotinate dehydrogenase subunit B
MTEQSENGLAKPAREAGDVMKFTIIVNGAERTAASAADRSLLEVLRDDLGVTGPKFGCGEGACGACTVLIGRRAVTACTMPASAAAGQRVTTVEGLAEDGILHPVQQAWLETGAMQCGYCTPGWLTATAALLNQVAHPDDARIATALAGNVCRCCSYPRIQRAIRRAAELMEEPDLLVPVPPAAAQARLGASVPALPWDVAARDADSFFELLTDGMVTVVEADDGGEDGGTGPAGPDAGDAAWVHVGADGTVTAFTGKVEAGQGTRTALALLVAEELAVPVGSVRVVMGDTSLSPFDLGTFGSRSMPYAAPPLRAAAAGSARLLRETAARRFGLDPGDLTAAGGMLAGPDGAPSISYGDLLAGQRRVERVAASEPVRSAQAWRSAGHPARALGAADVVTGTKRFPSDVRLDGMRHGCVLRPPAFGALLREAGTGAAEALPGVQLIRDGEFIGAVAPDRATALRAIGLIDASWATAPQPATGDLDAYLRSHPADGEGWISPFRHEQGDVEAALAAGPVRIDACYSAAYIAHVPLEPRAAVARWTAGRVTVWAGTSTPFRARGEVAAALGIAESDVEIIVPDYGGGFGGKHGGAVAIEAARLARAAGCPVKLQWSRDEEFHQGYLRPAALLDVRCSADASGAISGWSFTNINSGQAGIQSPYRIPHQRVAFQPAESPLPQGPYRALASTANHFARESVLDELAGRLGADPLAFRLRHLDDERLAAVLRAAALRFGWEDGRGWPGPGTGAGAGLGTGIALGTEKGGRVATAAQVRVGPDGRLEILRLVTAFDCGAVVSPDNLVNQVEGAVMMGLGGAMFEAIDFAGGRILNASMSGYRVPRLPDLPEFEVVLIDRPDQPSAGAGEAPIVAVAPAIGNAIFHACGVRLRSLPLAPGGVVRTAR